MAGTGIKILQWNIISFKVRNLELLSHIQDCHYDVIILQETGISSKGRACINVQGYSLYFPYAKPDSKRTHGLITAVSNNTIEIYPISIH